MKIKTTIYVEKRAHCRSAMESPMSFHDAEAKLKNGILEITQLRKNGNEKTYFPLGVINYWCIDTKIEEDSAE